MGVRVADLCRAASIITVGQLADMTADELRAKSFAADLIPYICLKLQQANPSLNLETGFRPAAGAQGRAAAISCLPNSTVVAGYGMPVKQVYGA